MGRDVIEGHNKLYVPEKKKKHIAPDKYNMVVLKHVEREQMNSFF